MKKIILLILSVLVVGCAFKQNNDGTYSPTDSNKRIIVFDSCEYFYVLEGNSSVMAHKGNCKYCEERRRQELKEFINK